MWNEQKIKEIVESHPVVVFAKGTRDMPMCGFSARAMDILNRFGKPYEVVNIFDDPEIKPSLVKYSGWPTTPQVFIRGELIGGSDIAMELFETGELKQKIDAAYAPS